MNHNTVLDENIDFPKSINIWRHLGKFTLIIVVLKLTLFYVGTFLKNGTFQMALLTAAYFIAFSSTSILMIKTYRRSTKLNFTEKLIAVVILFLVYEIIANLTHLVYFTLILGENPSFKEVLNKTLEILKYDSLFILVLTIIISVFVKSKVIKAS